MNPIAGHTVRHRWTEGAFAGGTFENSYHLDGSMTYRAVEGSYAGATGTFKQYSVREAAPGVWLMSWLEDSGYTVNIVSALRR